MLRKLKTPAFESRDRFLERHALIGSLGEGQQFLIGHDGEVDSFVVVLGARETRGVVREVCFRELILRKPRGHLLPTRDSLSRIGLRQRPEMPRSPVVGIGRNRARCKLADHLRSGPDQPVMIRERNQGSRIMGTIRNSALQRRQRVGEVSGVCYLWLSHSLF